MKKIIFLLSLTSLIYGASAEISDDSLVTLAPSEAKPQEIASLEMPSLLQTSMQAAPIGAPSLPAPVEQKSPLVAVSLNLLFPGLGHFYLDELEMAGGFMASTGIGLGLLYGDAIRHEPTLETMVYTVTNISLYSTYATYRDARLKNGSFQYSYKMPKDDLKDLTLAPFKLNILKKPEVWGGILGFLTLGTTLSYYVYPDSAKIRIPSASRSTPSIVALPVGVGEEAFFRGYLQSAISEQTNPITGTILSSMIFGAVHATNAENWSFSDQWRYYAFSIPFIATFGGYLGWLTHKNQSLQESVAIHSWYDFILFALSSLGSEAMMTGRPGFAFSTSF